MEENTIKKPLGRFFYISYNGVNPVDNKPVIGHLAFNHYPGFPSMVYICDVMVPGKSRVPVENVVMTTLYEFQSEQDFEDFITGYDYKSSLGLN